MRSEAIDDARDELAHTTDGPVTGTVLVFRALQMIHERRASVTVVGAALLLELRERGVDVDAAETSRSQEIPGVTR